MNPNNKSLRGIVAASVIGGMMLGTGIGAVGHHLWINRETKTEQVAIEEIEGMSKRQKLKALEEILGDDYYPSHKQEYLDYLENPNALELAGELGDNFFISE